MKGLNSIVKVKSNYFLSIQNSNYMVQDGGNIWIKWKFKIKIKFLSYLLLTPSSLFLIYKRRNILLQMYGDSTLILSNEVLWSTMVRVVLNICMEVVFFWRILGFFAYLLGTDLVFSLEDYMRHLYLY